MKRAGHGARLFPISLRSAAYLELQVGAVSGVPAHLRPGNGVSASGLRKFGEGDCRPDGVPVFRLGALPGFCDCTVERVSPCFGACCWTSTAAPLAETPKVVVPSLFELEEGEAQAEATAPAIATTTRSLRMSLFITEPGPRAHARIP